MLAVVASQLDRDLKREYEEAVRKAPEEVLKEAKMECFLQAEHNDPLRSAVRLCRYWKTRKHAFQDRWLLPMNQVSTFVWESVFVFSCMCGICFGLTSRHDVVCKDGQRRLDKRGH